MYTFEELQVQKNKTSAKRKIRGAKVRTQYMKVEGVEVIHKRNASRKARRTNKAILRNYR
jgi:hypothetical protein